ncbi:hypothetical protein TNCV_2508511, partial [Trichonephila clavipes]
MSLHPIGDISSVDRVTGGSEDNCAASQGLKKSRELTFTLYEYESIMHYGNYAFSKQPKRLATMVAKNGKRLFEPEKK